MGKKVRADSELAPVGYASPSVSKDANGGDLKCKVPERKQELFLPIHGHVDLFAEELAIVDHPAFQRLRRVRQLGLAHMVFPGATHSRFEHSIGAVHVAQIIIDHVNANCDKAKDQNKEWAMVEINEATRRFIKAVISMWTLSRADTRAKPGCGPPVVYQLLNSLISGWGPSCMM